MSGLVSQRTQEHSSDNIFKMRSLSGRARAYINFAPGFISCVHTLGILGRVPKTGFHKTRFTHVHVSTITKFEYQLNMDGLVWFVSEIV